MSARPDDDAAIAEHEIEDALRGLRPERDAFREAVERRLRAANAGPRAHDAADEARSVPAPWLRRAAAWLPGAPLASPLAGGSSLSLKALPGLLALPALVFAMLVAPVFFALQSVVQRHTGPTKHAEAVNAWWREHRRGALLVLAAIGLLFLLEPASAGVALLLVSAGVLALLLARLRAAGFGSRGEVARSCANVLLTLALWMALVDSGWRGLFPSERSAHVAFSALVAAGVVCAWIALRTRHPTLWHLVTRSQTADALLLVQLALFAPWSAFVGLASLWRPESLHALEEHAERVRPFESLGWQHASDMVAWVTRHERAPDLDGLREHWRRNSPVQAGDRGSYLAAGIELGFLAPDEIEGLARVAGHLVRDDGPLVGASLRERADLLALVRAETLTEGERDRLARRLLASRRPEAPQWSLSRLTTVARLLDELGRTALADGLRGEAHALLSECWIPPKRFGRERAGFRQTPAGLDPSANTLDTCDAVALMLRFGVPHEIDLDAVGRELERVATRVESEHWNDTARWRPPLALSQLRLALLPPRGPLGVLLDNRVLLALLALAGFCLAATLRAPRRAS